MKIRQPSLPFYIAAMFFSAAVCVFMVQSAEPDPIPAGEGEIKSIQFSFEKREGLIRHVGDVRLVIPGALNLNCDDLLAQRDAAGKFSTIIATTNVVIQLLQISEPNPAKPGPANGTALNDEMIALTNKVIETNWAYAFKAVFIGTNNSVVLTGSPETGSPRVVTSSAEITAEELIYNRTTGKFTGSGKSRSRFKVGQFNLNPKRESGTNSP